MDRQLLKPSQMDGKLTYRYDSVRHEALCDRMEVGNLHRVAIAAAA